MVMEDASTLARISIRGVVQGVGFRPFVYQLAGSLGLTGWVCNTSGDVKIEVEGPAPQIHRFLSRLHSEAPPLARMEELACTYGEPPGYAGFEIRESVSQEGTYQRISPDIATCDPCRKEIFHPGDRRYRYAFTNCTNCGPRFTIIRDIPYDRPRTTMQPFEMCPECRQEYEDPLNRRFHAQPNCCPWCGPRLEITGPDGRPLPAPDPLSGGASLLRAGKILALKGMGGFLLACDATSEKAVRELRRRKRRPFKPFAVMMTGLEEVRKICALSPEEERELCSPRAPIVLLRIKDPSVIAPGVCPNLGYLGVMLPYTPLHHLLMKETRLPLVMTSGNLSEEPIVGENAEALEKLSAMADAFLLHNRDIHARCDDSVVLVEGGRRRWSGGHGAMHPTRSSCPSRSIRSWPAGRTSRTPSASPGTAMPF